MCKKIVKKHRSYLVLLIAFLFGSAANAAVNNYVGAYGFLGEWSMMPSQSSYQTSFGVAGGAGFMYELQAGAKYKPTRFLFDVGLGVWGGMSSYGQGTNQAAALPNETDLQGETFDYIYEIKNRHDQYNSMAVQIPIMIGVQHKRFYMLAGAKVNMHVLTMAHTTANVTTYGRYEKIPDLRNMPDYQFFTDKPLKGAARTTLKPDIAVSLEMGGRIGVINDAVGYDVPKRKTEIRLAGFIDYGLTDIHNGGTNKGLITDGISYDTNPLSTNYVYQTTTMINNLKTNDIMSTQIEDASGKVTPFAKSVNSFMIGLKFTILFQLPEPGQCVICRDGYRSSIRSRRGRLKYEE